MQNPSYLKTSVDGVNGSGKTCTVAQLACGLALEYGNGRAVHVFDSSDRWPAWKLHIFNVEQIPLVITYGRSIAALQEAIERANDQQCAVFVGDDLTVPWMDGLKSFAFENGNLPFDRRQQLMNEWERFVEMFQLGEFDALACGRLGYHWENIEGDDGTEQLHQGDSKFNAGGSANFAYDCILELEMRRRKRRIMGLLRGKTSIEYICDVIKDANSVLNGRQFVFTDFERGHYEKGDYRKVFDHFRPHIEFRRGLERVPFSGARTRDLLVTGKTSWATDQAERKHLLEEIDANLGMAFPSGEGKSKLAKMFRDLTLEFLNGFISWSRMEEETTTVNLRRNCDIVKVVRRRVESGDIPTTQEALKVLLNLATEDVLHPGRNISLLEAMGAQSIVAVKRRANGQGTHEEALAGD
jgi:hypothetical protein